MKYNELWNWGTTGSWKKDDGTDTQYKYEVINSVLYIAFQGSDSKLDWWQNFSFWKKPYKRMKKIWFAHAGFLKKWKSVEKAIANAIIDEAFNRVVIFGFSQGAGIATLCHEWIWFTYPALRDKLSTIVCGSPRVIGTFSKISERFDNLNRFSIVKDIVTKVPFFWMFYKHVGSNNRFKGNYPFYCIVKNHMAYYEYL